MMFFKVMLQMYFECKAIGNYREFANTLKNSKGAILNKFEEKTSTEYLAENNTVKMIIDLIGTHMVNTESNSELVKKVISRLNLASTETKYTEYKIGFTFFNAPSNKPYYEGKLNYNNISKIAKVASSMTNIERNKDNIGMIIVGVADDEKTYKQWAAHFGKSAYRYNSHRVVGVDEEAKQHYKSIDNMMRAFNSRIDLEPISEELKENLKNYEILTIHNKTLVVFTITAETGQLYDGKKLFVRVQVLN